MFQFDDLKGRSSRSGELRTVIHRSLKTVFADRKNGSGVNNKTIYGQDYVIGRDRPEKEAEQAMSAVRQTPKDSQRESFISM